MGIPRPPKGLQVGARALWRSVMNDFELGKHEESVLLQACRIVDLLDELQEVLDKEPAIVSSPQGTKANPAAVEFRQQSLTLAKLMASLRIPLDEDQQSGRGQQRVGVRRASLGAGV